LAAAVRQAALGPPVCRGGRRWGARRLALAAALLLVASGCQRQDAHPPGSLGIERHPGVRDLYAFAEAYRAKHDQPALGVGVVHRGRIVGLGMAGERVAGSRDWATVDDAFDVASCSKSVTATIAALLVDEGAISWDTTVVAAFPELRDRIHPGYAKTTLERLLRHTGGVGHELNRNVRWSGWHREHAAATPAGQRLAYVRAALARPPMHAPGSATAYTSDGYVIAGSMLERAAGIAWEQLVETHLRAPLQLHSMRYGPRVDGTWTQRVVGHESGWFGRPLAIIPDPAEYGSQPFGSPAGFLYSSVPDLLRYVDFHIQGDNGRGRLMPHAAFLRLHDAAGGPYALGWQSDVRRNERGAIVERSLYHGGYSGRFRANLWFVPETQWGTAIVMNHGRGDDAITSDVFHALLREFGVGARP
jgi:CubicO group peptidase (beta-lactamase class C family)